MAAAAAASTANVGSNATRNLLAYYLLVQTTILLVMINAETFCAAFNAESFHKRAIPNKLLGTRGSTRVHRPRFDKAIIINYIITMKATSVDQEEERGLKIFHSISPTICEEPSISFRSDHIDRVELWYFDKLEECYSYVERHVKCPFFRRRFGDVLDDIEGLIRFFLIRPYFKDSSSRLGPPISSRSLPGWGQKTKHLPVDKILDVLRKDWRAKEKDNSHHRSDLQLPCLVNEKGYYVTGRMSTYVYRDDCEFLSPDPDLPLQGLRKYIGVTTNLFDYKTSHSKLKSLEQINRRDAYNKEGEDLDIVLKAEWRISLTMKLPWKPQLSEFSGSTLYFLDEDNLIYRHQETWDISVLDAFLGMITIAEIHNKNVNSSSNNNNNRRCPLSVLSLKKWP
eukprot:CAMPEP_0197187116 /NCGR_PEP_ID=MMETSP1423-20130617/15268_1 /TAXON_ID=476441 /ORGANISM="Pseudo-nitzschia heimii, Strain UNC1101" /LENGTH=395 /DNA_ID=CAMNT_0042638609 /DNA_START=111 /DNA_END=1298 /DNA_ORIENTATION=-